jgi:quercetin dioxygenase-like cupin family protein
MSRTALVRPKARLYRATRNSDEVDHVSTHVLRLRHRWLFACREWSGSRWFGSCRSAARSQLVGESQSTGVQIATVAGDPGKAGPYVIRARYPPNTVNEPHYHPTDEEITVLSSTLYFGQGMTMKHDAMALPAGSFVAQPVNRWHFLLTKPSPWSSRSVESARERISWRNDLLASAPWSGGCGGDRRAPLTSHAGRGRIRSSEGSPPCQTGLSPAARSSRA